jgi:hypothetical protein
MDALHAQLRGSWLVPLPRFPIVPPPGHMHPITVCEESSPIFLACAAVPTCPSPTQLEHALLHLSCFSQQALSLLSAEHRVAIMELSHRFDQVGVI